MTFRSGGVTDELLVYRHVEATRHYRALRELESEPTFRRRMAARWRQFIRPGERAAGSG
ncbi:hypothetical protein [Salinisphaera dokdonensis]|uniref:hypothetical protein n=1 Tax=Salinisphaera dokdonensis TaxID=454598 RepID=UPI00333F400F